MSLMSSQVVRMCVACRERGTQKSLIRVVCSAGQLDVDYLHKAQGRGAYLHPTPECIGAAVKRRLFARALKVPADVDVTALHRLLDEVTQPSTTA